jgi:hypothetical protein
MDIKVPIEELRKRKLFVATPMYGGQCAGLYTRSTNDLSALAVHYGIEVRFYYLFNESLITRARNYCCDEFLRSDCTHLLFIDSDIGFNAQDVFTMLALQSDESDYDVLCAPYPKKCIAWEKIKVAVDKGFADKDANILERFVGDYVFNPAGNKTEIPLNEPSEVLESGTGFMMIRRSALENYREAYPTFSYKPDHVRTAAFDGSREIHAFFDCVIDPETKRYLSEDYMFCQYARKAGMKVWLLPWIQLHHVGTYIFGGSLVDLAQLGVTATADPSQLGSKR